MSAVRRSIRLVYDVLSPYSYVGFKLLREKAPKWNVDVELDPILLGGLFQAAKNSPPAFVQAKGVHMFKDLKRLNKYGINDIQVPDNVSEVLFKKGSLKAQRLITAVKLDRNDKLLDLTEALFNRIWRDNLDITQDDSLLEACKAAGFSDADATKFLSRSRDSDVKNELKEATDRAVKQGVFGAPTFFIGEEMFFGSDRFDHLEEELKLMKAKL